MLIGLLLKYTKTTCMHLQIGVYWKKLPITDAKNYQFRDYQSSCLTHMNDLKRKFTGRGYLPFSQMYLLTFLPCNQSRVTELITAYVSYWLYACHLTMKSRLLKMFPNENSNAV